MIQVTSTLEKAQDYRSTMACDPKKTKKNSLFTEV